jgi:hypothetical protein
VWGVGCGEECLCKFVLAIDKNGLISYKSFNLHNLRLWPKPSTLFPLLPRSSSCPPAANIIQFIKCVTA